MARKYLFVLLAITFLVLSAFPCLACSDCTPTEESLERGAITEALRKNLIEGPGVEAVFAFNWFRVMDGWAWVETEPRSPDGQNKYEPFLALLNKDEGTWTVVEIPPLEEDSPPVDDEYFKGLLERFPGIPEEIFPWEE